MCSVPRSVGSTRTVILTHGMLQILHILHTLMACVIVYGVLCVALGVLWDRFERNRFSGQMGPCGHDFLRAPLHWAGGPVLIFQVRCVYK